MTSQIAKGSIKFNKYYNKYGFRDADIPKRYSDTDVAKHYSDTDVAEGLWDADVTISFRTSQNASATYWVMHEENFSRRRNELRGGKYPRRAFRNVVTNVVHDIAVAFHDAVWSFRPCAGEDHNYCSDTYTS